LTVAKLEELVRALKISNKLQLVTAIKKHGKPAKAKAATSAASPAKK
jgi:hypothetical protein